MEFQYEATHLHVTVNKTEGKEITPIFNTYIKRVERKKKRKKLKTKFSFDEH